MSKDITLFGQDYSSVPAINVPLQGGGTARFIDEDEAGGGGGSTAKITIVNTSAGNGLSFIIDTVVKDRSGEWGLPANTWIAPGTYEGAIDQGQTKQIDAVLIPPNGSAIVSFQAADCTYTVTGNATALAIEYGKEFLVTGDCSITVSA